MAARRGWHPYGEFWLGREGRPGLGGTRALLLESIGETGSLAQAAREAGISYRKAWTLLEELNALSRAPLVRSVSGGSRGGGSRLTDHGEELLGMFRALREEHARCLADLSARMRDFDRTPAPARGPGLATSARNQLRGRVQAIAGTGLVAEVDLRIGAQGRVRARITRTSLESLGLRRGDPAYALIKANWVSVAPSGGRPEPGLNRLGGRILSLREEGGEVECVLRLPGGASLVSTYPASRRRTARLAEGGSAAAVFDPAQVILGVAP
jgi:molybdate transport system regulatory protein